MINNYDSVETCLLKGSANSKKQESTSFTRKKGTFVSFMAVFLMLFSFLAQAQSINNYAFTYSNTSSLEDLTTGSTSLLTGTPPFDDVATTVQAIGFDFYFMGVKYTHFSANSNGQLRLHTSSGATAIAGGNITTYGASIVTLAPLAGDNEVGDNIKIKVIGSAPNRKLVVEWTQFYVQYANITNSGNTQLWLSETSGRIDYVYGAIYNSTTAVQNRSVFISSGNTATSSGHVLIGATPTFTAAAAPVTNTIAASTSVTAGIATPLVANLGSSADGSRWMYSFTPNSAAVSVPTNLTFSGITSAGTSVNWVDDSTSEFGFLVTRATDAAFTTNVVTTPVASTTVVATGGTYNSIQTGLLPNTLYYYKVQALSEAIFSSEISGSQATNPPGVFISIADGNWSNPATWDANSVPTGFDSATVAAHTVSIDVAGLAINNLTVQGSLEFGATPATFNVNGNLTLEAGSEFLVFNGTTGKALVVSGNIINDGNIDLSVGATTAGSLTLNGSAVQSITGSGTFANNLIRNLIFSNTSTTIPNINWDFDDITVAYNLNISNAKINLNGNKITFGIGSTVTADTGNTFTSTNGGFLNGTFSRWWTAAQTGYTTSGPTAIPAGAAGRYPFYSPTGEQRIFYIGRTAPSAGGKYAVTYNNATTSTTGLNIVDGAATITNRWDGNFLVTLDGTTPAATSNWVTMFTPGAFFTTATGARVLGQNGALSGTHVNTSNAPFGQRSGVLTADLIAATGLYLGVNAADVPVVSIASGDWNSTSTWSGGVVPTCADVAIIANGHTVTSSTSGNFAKGISIVSGGTLEVSAGDLTVGCTLNNNTLTNNGTLTVSGGLLAVNGNISNAAGSTFNHTGGNIDIDGNNGGSATGSVASGTPLLLFLSNNINLAGGTITIIDPHTATTNTNAVAVKFDTSSATANSRNTSPSHILQFGDGVSTDAGGNTSGFFIDSWSTTGYLVIGKLVVNGATGTNRFVSSRYNLSVRGDIDVEANSTLNLTTPLVLGGNLLVKVTGNYTNTSGTALNYVTDNTGSNLTFSPVTLPQTITNNGVMANAVASPTANLFSLEVNNTNAVGVTLNSPISISGTLTMTSGFINTTDSNLLTLGTATVAGTLAGTPSDTNMVRGPFARTIANANANTNYILFPVGKTTYAPIWAAPATTAVSVMKAETFDTNTGTQSAAISNMATNRRWELPLVSGTINNINVRLGDAGVLATSIPVQAPSASGEYTSTFGSVATAVVGVSTQSNTSVLGVDYTGFLSYADSNACVGTPTPGNTIASVPTICFGDSVTFSLENLTAGSGVTYQWQSSSDGIAYSDIVGATNPTYTASPSSVTYYQCIVTCSAGPSSATSTPVQITFTNNILTTTPASRCGTGTVTLEATANAGTTIEWFANQTDQVVLATGSTFTTPSISSNTTYYVQANTGGSNYSVGALTPASQGGTQGNWTIGWSNNITVLSNTTLYSLDIFPLTSGQTGTFTVRNGFGTTGTVIATINYTTNVSGGSTAQTLLFNVPLTPGNYSIYSDVLPAAGLRRNISGATHPYTSPVANLVGNGYDNAYYMGLYNIIFKNGCSSPRVPVLATVSTPPVLTLSGTNATICSGDSSSVVTLTAGALDYNTFVWSPATGVTGDETIGWTFNPTITTAYTLTATQTSGALCATTATYTVNVNPLPTNVIITPAAPSICINTVQSLAVTGGTVGIVGKVGAGTSTNTTSTPFRGWYGGSKTQALYTPAELTALGVEAGQSIRSIGYVALSGTPIVLNNFTINAGFVSNTTLGAAFIPGATNVVLAPTNYTPAATGNIDFTLSTPLTWDGVSSLLIETCFNNNNGGGVSANSISVQSTVVAAGLNIYLSQDNNATVCTNVDVPSTTTTRPNLRISTLETANITWSPVTNLFTDAAATIPYVAGSNATTVYVQSATPSTTVYTATATIGATGCFRSNTVSVTVSALPDVTISRVDDTLTAAETGATYQWYTCTAGPVYTIIPGATSQSYVATAIGSYAVDVTLNGCTSRSTCFDVTALGSSSFDMNALTVYPNPVVDILSIRYNEEITAINVYDLSGRLVKQITPNQTEVEVNMSELAAAMYIVKVKAGGNQTEIKVIKK